MKLHQYKQDHDYFKEFRIDCDRCCGLCCTALYFSKFDGFPSDKAAGVPCSNLDGGFRCLIHQKLQARHMKGCLAYDCCGAGQLVASLYSEQRSTVPSIAQEMFDVFVKAYYLQQMRWYLSEVLTLPPARALWDEAGSYMNELRHLLESSPQGILDFNMEILGIKVSRLLRNSWEMTKVQAAPLKETAEKKDLMGHHFKRAKLNGTDFSSALLIAANLEDCGLAGCNFLGADMRDANIKNADLRDSIFLTQGQLNGARGNMNTCIPEHLITPPEWAC